MGKKTKIRPIALCLLRRNQDILIYEGYDSVKQEAFVRLLGGGIEFGETSQTAMVREIKEELGANITDVKLLGVVESIFEYEGKPGHEIVFVFDGRFIDTALYDRDSLPVVEGERTFTAHWRSLEELRSGEAMLVPEKIWDLL